MTSFPYTLVFAVFALAFVLVLAWFILKAISALTLRSARKGDIQIKTITPVGARERLVIATYRNNDYLLGITQHTVQLLDKHVTLPDPLQTPPEDETT